MGKGEIARNEQFLLFMQCFPKTCTVKTRACLGKGQKHLTFSEDLSSLQFSFWTEKTKIRLHKICSLIFGLQLTKIPQTKVISVYLSLLPVAHLSNAPEDS